MTLIPVVKDAPTLTYTRTGRQQLECWGAVSADGQWRFQRTEHLGTPWKVTHRDHPQPAWWDPTLANLRHWVTVFGPAWLEQQQREAA